MTGAFTDIFQKTREEMYGGGMKRQIAPGPLHPSNLPDALDPKAITEFRQRHPELTRTMDNHAISLTMRQIASSPNTEEEFTQILARARTSTSEPFWRWPWELEALAYTTDPLNPLTFIPVRGVQEQAAAFSQGFQQGVAAEPLNNILQAFGAMADSFGNEELGDTVRGWAYKYDKLVGDESFEDEFLYNAGNFAGMLAPSALSLVVSGGASGPMVAYFAIQGFGGGVREYRERMIANGLEPDAIDQIMIGAGYGMIEVAAEKLGLDLIGRVGRKAAGQIGDAFLRGDAAAAARLIGAVTAGAGVEGLEEVVTQGVQNAIAANGFWFAPGFDPDRPLENGVAKAFGMGALGGGLLTAPAMFAPRARQEMAAGMRSATLQLVEEERARRASQAIQEATGVEVPVVEPGPAVEQRKESPSQNDIILSDRKLIDIAQSILDDPMATERQQKVARRLIGEVESGTVEQEVRDAVEERVEPEGDLVQRPEAEEGREVAEAERGDRDVEGREEQVVEEEVVPRQEDPVETSEKVRVIVERQKPTITERAALRASIRAQARVARQLERQHRQETKEAVRTAVKEERAVAREKAQNIEGRRKELRRRIYAIPNLTSDDRKTIWSALAGRSLKTDAALGKATAEAMQRVEEIFDERSRTRARKSLKMVEGKKAPKMKGLKTSIGGVPLRTVGGVKGLLPKYRAAAEQAMSQIADPETGELDRKAIANMTREEADQMADEIEDAILGHIEEFGAEVQKRQNRQKFLNEMVRGEITEAHVERARDPLTGLIDPDRVPGLRDFVAGMGTQTLDTLAERLGGGDDTITHQLLFQTLIEASNDHKAGYFDGRQVLIDAIEAEGIVVGSNEHIAMSKILAREDGVWNKVKYAITDRPLQALRGRGLRPTIELRETGVDGLQFSAAEFIDFWMQMQDPETRELIRGGAPIVQHRNKPMKLTEEQIAGIMSRVKPSEQRIGQKMVDYINGPLKDRMREWSIRNLGYDITNPDTHVPRQRKAHGGRDVDVSIEAFEPGKLAQITDKIDITLERDGGYKKPILIRDSFGRYEEFVWKSEGLTTSSDAILTVKRVLQNRQVRSAIEDSQLGPTFMKGINSILNRHASDVLRSIPIDKAFSDAAVQRILSNINVGLLQINPRVALFQVGSYYAASSEIDINYLTRAMGELGAFGMKSELVREVEARMLEGSASLRFRHEGSIAARTTEAASIAGRGRVAGVNANDQGMMAWIHQMDSFAITRIWRAAELAVEQQIQNGTVAESSRATAVRRLAERAVNRTQPTFETLTTTLIGQEARDSAAKKAFTMFRSARSKIWDNMQRAAIRYNRVRNDPNATPAMKREARNRLMSASAFGVLANSAWVAFVKAAWGWAFGGEDDEETIAVATGRNLVDAVFGLVIGGEFAAGATQHLINAAQQQPSRRVFDADISPVLGVVNNIWSGSRLTLQSIAEEDPERFWDGFVEGASALMVSGGLPGGAFRAASRDIEKVFFED